MRQFVDFVIGNDSNSGSMFQPKKTYAAARATLGGIGAHEVFLRAGQDHPLTSTGSAHGGLSGTARSYIGRYGDGPNPRIVPAWTPSGGSLWWQLSMGGGFITIEDLVFDCLDSPAFDAGIGLAINGAADLVDVVFNRCETRGAVVGFSAGHISLTYAANAFSGIKLNYHKSIKNRRHGYYNGGTDIEFYRCQALQNGWADGGHGFSSQGDNYTQVTSGWTLVNGTTYKRGLSLDALGVWTGNGSYRSLIKNTGTPTAPALGEWGMTGGELFINVGANPAGFTVTYVQIPQKIVRRECSAIGNRAFAPYPFIEGTGFQADDFSTGVEDIDCYSAYNAGSGFAHNSASGCRITNCVAVGNAKPGMGVQNSVSSVIQNFISVSNNRGGQRYPTGEAYPGDPDEVMIVQSPLTSIDGLTINAVTGQRAAIWVNDTRSSGTASNVTASGVSSLFGGAGSLTGTGNSVVPDAGVSVHAATALEYKEN